MLSLHKIKLFQEIQWWLEFSRTTGCIDWLNEPPQAVSQVLAQAKRYFLDVEFAPDDHALGLDTSSRVPEYCC